MSSKSKPRCFAGIDVSGRELVVRVVHRSKVTERTFPNTFEGHKKLLKAVRPRGGRVRVVLEATGNFHLDLALFLSGQTRVELMVVNPLAARRFAEAIMRRAKTDRVDAAVLAEFAQCMPFEAWTPPTQKELELRGVARFLSGLIKQQTRLKNQLAAAKATDTTPAFVVVELELQLATLADSINKAQAEALRVACSSARLAETVELLCTIPGIGVRSAVLIVAEFAGLDPSMTPDQLVAHAGLDPRPKQSGMTKGGAKAISRMGNARLRGALYMPALTAIRCCPAVSAWYDQLISKGKHARVAQVAVMRRLLRVVWAIQKSRSPWNEAAFAPKKNRKAA